MQNIPAEIQKMLLPGENIHIMSKINKFVLFFPVVLLLLVFLASLSPVFDELGYQRMYVTSALLFLFGILLICDIVIYKTTYILVTNYRIMGRVGFFSKRQITSPSEKIDAVTTSRGLFGAIFRFATIRIYAGRAMYSFHYIADYREIEKIINSAIINANKKAAPEGR